MGTRGERTRPISGEGGNAGLRLYGDLAAWWPLISPPEEYVEEAAMAASLIDSAAIPVREVLELGSGGGHNAVHLRARYRMTLVDLSEDMLAVSRALNPDCVHVRGDMRTVRLGRAFDAVFVHDAIDYMLDESDLRAVMETAYLHCRPGGCAVFVPDHTRENFAESSQHGGHDEDDHAGGHAGDRAGGAGKGVGSTRARGAGAGRAAETGAGAGGADVRGGADGPAGADGGAGGAGADPGPGGAGVGAGAHAGADGGAGGAGGPGRGARYLGWTWDPDPTDTWVRTDYAFLLREADRTVHSVHETHRTGLFGRKVWLRLLSEVGFTARMVTEPGVEDRPPRDLFVGHRGPAD